MTQERLSREDFYRHLARMDEAQLKKALWTLYWRGNAQVKERVLTEVEPGRGQALAVARQQAPNAAAVLAEVRQFAALAQAGAYLAGDRRVSPRERTRWRHTFRELSGRSIEGLRGDDAEEAAAAVALLVDVACRSRDTDLFRSLDPMEAARFVVSDAVGAVWARIFELRGPRAGVAYAVPQLVRWESEYGWTRHGDGWVAARETSLATVLGSLLTVPDLWVEAATHYAATLGELPADGGSYRRARRPRRERDLAQWHAMLVDRCAGTEVEALVARLVSS